MTRSRDPRRTALDAGAGANGLEGPRISRQARGPRPLTLLAATALLAGLACSAADRGGREASAWRAERSTEGEVTTVRTLSGSSWGGAAQLVEEASIGVAIGEDPYMFGRVADLAAGDGVVYALDSDVPVLRAYDPDGNHLRDVGAAGQGPGEYERPGALVVGPEGTVHVHDDSSDRITLYTPAGELVETWPGRQDGFRLIGAPMVATHDGVVYTQGRIRPETPEGEGAGVVTSDAMRWAMFPRGPDAATEEPIEVPRFDHEEPLLRVEISTGNTHMIMGQSIPFVPGVSWTLSPSGAMVAGLAEDYRFEIHYPDGSRTVVEKVWEPFPVSPEEADWHTRRLTALLRERAPDWTWEGPGIPARRPAFDALYADESSRVWVKRTGPAIHHPDCDPDPLAAAGAGQPCWESEILVEVFDLEGAYLGRVEWPDDVVLDRSTWIRGDTVLARGEDEAGTVRVKRYRLVRPADAAP